MTFTRIHYLQVLPVALLAILSAWHLHSYIAAGAPGSSGLHFGTVMLAFAMTLASLFFRGAEKESTRYLESLIAPLRSQLVGMACFVLGGLHFITIYGEPIFLKLGFLVLVLAFFETAGLANRFLPAATGDAPEVTKGTLNRLLLNRVGMLAMVFVLSVVLLYLSLMLVVGFTDSWTVGLMAALMLLAISFMAMVRNL